ncbi:MAG: DUF924 domain-containing protein, partial [Polyangiaceae bacterium]|nr:DUF924 domain-containing protein [Polyangiaceae bacterium]
STVLTFWFGQLDANGCADETHRSRWFTKDPDLDRMIRERFLELHASVVAGERESLLGSARGRLAYVIVIDQLSRNMFRGRPQMFEHDGLALRAAREGVERGDDRQLALDERVFLYMPFMHAEDLASQRRCCELFAGLRDEHEPPLRDRVAYNLEFAEAHLEIVERFGRFPHRNAVLGRTSTPDEIDFLLRPGSSF